MKFCFCSADSFKASAAANHLSESFQLQMLLHLHVPTARQQSYSEVEASEQDVRKMLLAAVTFYIYMLAMIDTT